MIFKYPDERKIAVLISIPIIFLFLISGASYLLIQAHYHEDKQGELAYQFISETDILLAALIDIETGQRGFAITGNELFLEPYKKGLQTSNDQIEKLIRLASGDMAKREKLNLISGLLAQKKTFSEEVIELRRSEGYSEAQIAIATGKGKYIMDRARSVLREIREAEVRHRDESAVRERNNEKAVIYVTLGGNILALALLIPSAYLVMRGIRARRELQEKYSTILDTALDGFLMFDAATGKIIQSNHAYSQMSGYAKEELADMSVMDLNTMERSQAARLLASVKEKKSARFETVHRRKDGTLWDIESGATYLESEGILFVFLRDITERKKTEKEIKVLNAALKSSELRYRTMFELSPDGVLLTGLDASMLEFNDAACAMLGYSREEYAKLRIPNFEALETPEDTKRHIEKVMHGGYDIFETKHRKKNGELIDVLVSVRLITLEEGPILFAIFRNITQLKRATTELRESKQLLDVLFNAITETVFIMDAEGVVLAINETGALRIGGRTPEQVIGQNVFGMVSREVGERRLKILEKIRETGETFRLLDQRDNMWIDQIVYPIKNADGVVTRFAIFAMDITKQKKAEDELKATLAELERSNRDLQEFVYVASHDLQEPLRKVTAFGKRIKHYGEERLDEKSKNYLNRLIAATERMQRLINDLLALSRVTTKAKPFEPVDLNAVAREVVEDFSLKIEQTGAKIELGKFCVVDSDPTQMRQLLQNLVGNAMKFVKPGVQPEIRIVGGCNTLPVEINGQNYGAGEVCVLNVVDNGVGFDEKYLEKIFMVFQRLHGRDEYEGTGMGLAICKKIVERHGGSITAKSAPGRGTTFTVTLPVRQTKGEGRK